MNHITDNIKYVFREVFDGAGEPLIIRSPGRVNIIGEHTDYNEGFVLPAAIDKAAYMGITLREDHEIHLVAHDLNEKFSINMEDVKPIGDISWPNYILGAASQVHKKTGLLRGFNAVLTSDVPIGAGLSSSAAVECATVFGLNALLSNGISRVDMVKMAQKAEHDFAGVMCGIMDQFASMMGKKDHVIKLDCRSLSYEYVPFKLEGIKVVLLNTNVKHSLASSEYNTRRQECEEAVKLVQEGVPTVQSLRDVSAEMLAKYVQAPNPIAYQRGLFIVEEIKRLQEACKDLQDGNLLALGKKMFDTHTGLSHKYDVSCKELDWLINFVKNRPGVLGARMMGGGFGGCTINLVKENAIDALLADIIPAYEEVMQLPLSFYIASVENGTEIVQS